MVPSIPWPVLLRHHQRAPIKVRVLISLIFYIYLALLISRRFYLIWLIYVGVKDLAVPVFSNKQLQPLAPRDQYV